MPDIKVENLTVAYGTKKQVLVTALDDLNLEIKSGTFNVVVGYSGCGKTTFLKCIAGLQEYDGEIFFDGINADSLSVKERNIAMVTQEYALFPSMNVFDNIALPLSVSGAPKEEIIVRVNELAEKLGIKHCLTRKPKHLSGGQQQRVALARALVKDPKLFLFDEPLSNFDYPTRVESKLLIKKIISEYHATTIYVTHDISEAMSLADNLIVLNDGHLEICGDPLTIYNSDNEVVKSLKGIIEA